MREARGRTQNHKRLAEIGVDQIALAEYPNRAALVRMATSPEYQEIAVHRAAGLAGQLNIETLPRFNLADVLAKSAG